MKKILQKAEAFLKKYGHKMFTFAVGLAFIMCVCFVIGLAARSVYRVFVPNDIYTDDAYAATLDGSSVYDSLANENTKEGSAEFFEQYVQNLVKQDMPDFDDPSEINDEYIISFGIWQAITLNNTQGVYTYDSKGNFRVPADDVEMFSSYCLDYVRKLGHTSVENCGEFKYNALSKTYTIKSSGVQAYLIPDVVDVVEGDNDTYVLTVDCYQASLLTSEDPTNDASNLKKRVKITLQDLGIMSYNSETGDPIHHYIYLSMETVDTDADNSTIKNEVDLN